jgi:biotin synthesis protein BioG
VYAAGFALYNSPLHFEKKIAINGTGEPIDDRYGIPEQIFTTTLNTWNEKNRERFNIRMCGGHSHYAEAKKHMSTRSIENQHDELKHIYDTHTQTNVQTSLVWDTAIIGTHDLIFSKENQENYWSKQVNSLILPFSHFPFFGTQKWENIIEGKI